MKRIITARFAWQSHWDLTKFYNALNTLCSPDSPVYLSVAYGNGDGIGFGTGEILKWGPGAKLLPFNQYERKSIARFIRFWEGEIESEMFFSWHEDSESAISSAWRVS